jgi:glycine/D-amino acid oxidase-like deaminating enzyme
MKILIIGQGISGTWLSYWLLRQGATVVVMDHADPNASSRVASGVINPVTGRQVVTTWMAETLIPFAEQAYTEMGGVLNATILNKTGILAFPPSAQMLEAYRQKMDDTPAYVHRVDAVDDYARFFRFSFDAVKISPAFHIDLPALLSGWRQHLLNSGALRNETFVKEKLEVQDAGLCYAGESFDTLVYCDGPAAFKDAAWQGLPFSFNKGEAVITEIPGLPGGQIYKFGITTLVPWVNGHWWLGSTYDNRFTDALPTAAFRNRMEQFLELTLKVPFTIKDHLAAIRPATIDRRPFAGRHPKIPSLAILNGTGTKGVSLAPFLGKQMAEHLLNATPLDPEVDISRFKRAFA